VVRASLAPGRLDASLASLNRIAEFSARKRARRGPLARAAARGGAFAPRAPAGLAGAAHGPGARRPRRRLRSLRTAGRIGARLAALRSRMRRLPPDLPSWGTPAPQWYSCAMRRSRRRRCSSSRVH
jgi:hypothetical protein